jgi:hypothetical protein
MGCGLPLGTSGHVAIGPAQTRVGITVLCREEMLAMGLKAVLCIPLGHKWAPSEEGGGTLAPVLRCQRCGRSGIFSEETASKISLEHRIDPMDHFGNRLP